MARDSVELELLVQRIQQQLAPKAEVLHNVRLPGRHTGASRQIDVLVHERVGQYDINIIIDCKDYKHPVDVKGVEEFSGLLDDVGAQKGILVCPAGFTAKAKTRAKSLQIDLYSPIDTDPHKWQVSPTIPALCDFRAASLAFQVSGSHPLPFLIPYEFFGTNKIFDSAGTELGTCYQRIVERWNSGEFAEELGERREIKIFGDTEVQTDNGYGQMMPVNLHAHLLVREQLFSGQLPVREVSGFRDEMSGHVITNAFSVGLLDPDEIIENWTPIADESELAVKPVIKLEGFVLFDEQAGVVFNL